MCPSWESASQACSCSWHWDNGEYSIPVSSSVFPLALNAPAAWHHLNLDKVQFRIMAHKPVTTWPLPTGSASHSTRQRWTGPCWGMFHSYTLSCTLAHAYLHSLSYEHCKTFFKSQFQCNFQCKAFLDSQKAGFGTPSQCFLCIKINMHVLEYDLNFFACIRIMIILYDNYFLHIFCPNRK